MAKKSKIFKKQILPLLDALLQVCDENDIPIHIAIQQKDDKIWSEGLYNMESNPIFSVLEGISTNKIQLMSDLPAIPFAIPHNGIIH